VTSPTLGRITERSTFEALRRPAGRSRRGAVHVSYTPVTAAEDEAFPLVGYAISRRCGNAVTRNRLRRRLRAIARELAPELAPGAYLVRTDPGATSLGHGELVDAVERAMASASVSARPSGGG
jgi:ribonuclease P protein component